MYNKSSALGTSTYAYDLDNLVEETNASGAVVARYSQGFSVDEPLAMLRSSTTSYYQADGLGSTTSLSSAAGALVQTYTFDSFGRQTSSSGSVTNFFQYTGREWDSETNLYYYRARYYDQRQGRFWTMDTFEGDPNSPPSLHKYLYADATPPNRLDPSGRDSIAELDISSAISETLDTISSIQKVVQIKDRISTIIDLLSAIKDLGYLLASEGNGAVLGLAHQLESAAFDYLGKEAINLPLELFESVARNTPRIVTANLLSPAKDAKLAAAFTAPDSAILLYVPGLLGNLGTFATGLKVAGRPLQLAIQGGFALLGMGFAGGGTTVQLFHVDLVTPASPGHNGPGGRDLDAWYDGRWLNYQVPQN